ncbi:hypothetical protein DFS34DRAFT_626519 [Phlyctochytrium arcticum]|nr:hypothetical protein DFS34DRAFT_626519 [Phlyctochytrium arcticum]
MALYSDSYFVPGSYIFDENDSVQATSTEGAVPSGKSVTEADLAQVNAANSTAETSSEIGGGGTAASIASALYSFLPSSTSSTSAATASSSPDIVESILMFPTYARMGLTPQQASQAVQIGIAAAVTPHASPTSGSPSERSSLSGFPWRSSLRSSSRPASMEQPPDSNLPSPAIHGRNASAAPASTVLGNLAAVAGENVHNWTVNVKGWVYATRHQSRRRKFILGLSKKMFANTTHDEGARSMHDERAGMFLADSVRNVHIKVAALGLAPSASVLRQKGVKEERPADQVLDSVEALEEEEVKNVDWDALQSSPHSVTLETDASGFFQGTFQIPHGLIEKWRREKSEQVADHHFLRVVAFKVEDPKTLHSLGSVDLVPPHGTSIISDIDDTIRDSAVHEGRLAALNSALFTEAREVPGMADAYTYLSLKNLNFHYVSSGPHQLYPTLSTFLKTSRFPPGSVNLRNVWESRETMNGRSYKHKVITRILQDFPDRKFILVGDSGERDIETYAGLHAVSPTQILKILIRDVTSHKFPTVAKSRTFPLGSTDIGDAMEENPLMVRLKAAYSGMDRQAWGVFKLAESIVLDERIHQIILTHTATTATAETKAEVAVVAPLIDIWADTPQTPTVTSREVAPSSSQQPTVPASEQGKPPPLPVRPDSERE